METIFIWYGHAAFGLTIGDDRILIDPFLTGNPAATVKAAELDADYILITHGHGDHIGDTLPIAMRTKALCISNFEICSWLSAKGVDTHAQHIGGGHSFPFGHLKLTPALHGSALPDGSYGGNPVGFLLTTPDGKKIYIAGDTGLFGDMQLIGDEGIDLAALPIGDNYTMGPEDALKAVKLLRPRRVVPVHYNTWDLIAQDPRAWKTRVEAETEAEVVILKPGESLVL
ncbi:MAG TPA: metal-dependent hydrolase [Anaerolineaceae bacterium]|jgi:L-ascorbate metabolism protein UlaG (beta-lactamase superfamily)|nr:metal-dependent hydrolase [Anaerolineaceae bacterium]